MFTSDERFPPGAPPLTPRSYVLSLSRHGPELAAGCSEGQVVILSTEGWED